VVPLGYVPPVGSERGSWEPLSPDELGSALSVLDAPWWLAGGWALDLFLGRQSRPHADIDALILRRDHIQVRGALQQWDAYAADPPGRLRPWAIGEELPPTVHDVWWRPLDGGPWAFQLMIDDNCGNEWVYRRDPRIRRPVDELAGPASTPHRLVLAPEIQLLYKSSSIRGNDQADFDAVRSALTPEQCEWLGHALSLVAPDHGWRADL